MELFDENNLKIILQNKDSILEETYKQKTCLGCNNKTENYPFALE